MRQLQHGRHGSQSEPCLVACCRYGIPQTPKLVDTPSESHVQLKVTSALTAFCITVPTLQCAIGVNTAKEASTAESDCKSKEQMGLGRDWGWMGRAIDTVGQGTSSASA